MKLTILVFTFMLVASAPGQWLETTIYLPDSAGGVVSPQTIACGPTGTHVYVGGAGRGVSVLDVESGQRLYRIETGSDVSAICYVPVRNKVYVASRGTDSLSVVDGLSGLVLNTLYVGRGPSALACLPSGDRVYCASAGTSHAPDSVVYEIDCSADTVRAVHFVGLNPSALCYNPANNMLYSADKGSNTVSVIACSGDSDVIRIPVDSEPSALACNPLNNKVYCANSHDTTVSVIDGQTHQVRAAVPAGNRPRVLCYDSLTNTVFCGNYGSRDIGVIDGAGDSVIARILLSSPPTGLELDSDSNRVYCLVPDHPGVAVIDAATNLLVDSIPMRGELSAMCFVRQARSLCIADEELCAVAAFGCDDGSLRHRTRLGIDPEMLVVNPSGTKLYAIGGVYPFDSVSVSAIDPQLCDVNKCFELQASGRPGVSCYNSVDDKFYYAGSGPGVVVVDAQGDSVLGYVTVPDNVYGLAYAAAVNKAYVGGGYFDGYLAAIDGQGDTLVATVAIPGGGGVYGICHNSGHGTVYGFGNQRAVFTVLDCGTDTVIGQFPGEENPGAALYNPISDKVYMVAYVSGVMLVIDGTTNEVLARIDIGNGARDICLNTTDNKIYSTGETEDLLGVVDGGGDSLIAALNFPSYTGRLAYDPDFNITYCVYTGQDSRYVALVDGATQYVAGRIPLVGTVSAMAAIPQVDRVFVADLDNSCVRVIRTGAGAVSEQLLTGASRIVPEPTIVRSVLRLASVLGQRPEAARRLLDISGRKVLDLHEGANDVSALAPGVYFVRESSGVRKVVLAK